MSVATATAQGESYVYGGVLFQRVSESKPLAKPPRVGFATSLWQGLTTGAVLTFAFALFLLLYDGGTPYNYLFVAFFPFTLGCGLVTGFVEGLVIWICARIAGHNLRWFTRLLIAALVLGVPYAAILCISYSAYGNRADVETNLILTLIATTIGATFGFLTGSRFSPWCNLVRREESLPAGSWFATGLTGLVLRVTVIFFLMEAILAFIVILQQDFRQDALVLGATLLLHFILASAIVFARLKFGLLFPFAVILNIPVGLFLNYLFKEGWDFFVYVGVGYLGVWTAFLIAHCPVTYRLFDFLKEEVHYYLID